MDALALVSGAACKLYDDLNDTGRLPNPVHQRILEGFQFITLTLISSSNVYLAVFFYLANVANAIFNVDEWDKPFETAILVLYPVIILATLGKAPTLTRTDWLGMIAMVVSLAIEPILVPEEASPRKFKVRFTTAYGLLLAVLVLRPFLTAPSVTLLSYGVGYFSTSSIIQMLTVFGDRPPT